MKLDSRQLAAVLAGLRLLQEGVCQGELRPLAWLESWPMIALYCAVAAVVVHYGS